jgi:hypothetical protein
LPKLILWNRCDLFRRHKNTAIELRTWTCCIMHDDRWEQKRYNSLTITLRVTKLMITYMTNRQNLHDLYYSHNIVRANKLMCMKWAGHVDHMGEMRCLHNLVEESSEKRPNWRSRLRFKENCKRLVRLGCEDVEWFNIWFIAASREHGI